MKYLKIIGIWFVMSTTSFLISYFSSTKNNTTKPKVEEDETSKNRIFILRDDCNYQSFHIYCDSVQFNDKRSVIFYIDGYQNKVVTDCSFSLETNLDYKPKKHKLTKK